MARKRPTPGVEHRRLRILPEELYVILPLLDEHRFSPYARAILAEAVKGNLPRDLSPVPPIVAALEKNTCLAIERELLARARDCARRLGLTLNQFLRAVLFRWEGRDAVQLRVPPDQYLKEAA